MSSTFMYPEVDDVFKSEFWSHKFGMGKWVTKFEEEFARRNNVKHCCLYSCGTLDLVMKMVDTSAEKFELDIREVCSFKEFDIPLAFLTDSKDTWLKLKIMCSQGYDFEKDYDFTPVFGLNFRPTELMGAVLYHFLVNERLTKID